MSDTYLAAVIWRLEHMTEADHRAAAEQAGRMVAAVGRRRPRIRLRPRRQIACDGLPSTI